MARIKKPAPARTSKPSPRPLRLPTAKNAAPALKPQPVTSSSPAPHPDSTWTFLTNHALVLLSVAEAPDARVRDVAERVGITERAVQRILTELEEAKYLERDKHGRRNSYEINPDMPLRHPIKAHRTIRELLNLVRPRA